MDKKIKLGIIGVGHMGQYHVNVAKQIQDIEVVGVFDNDQERTKFIANKFSTNGFSDQDDLIEKSDALIIAAPTFTHYPIAIKALKQNKHVLLEKPISETVEQARELVNTAKSNQLIFQIGHVERFNGAILELSKIVIDPFLIEVRRLAPFAGRINDVGVVLDLMIHDIDIVLNMVKSKVVHVSAVGTKVMTKQEDVATVILKFENGCIARIVASRCTQAKIRKLEISQKDTYIQLDFASQEIELHRHALSNTQLSGDNSIKYKQESIVEKIFVHKDNPLKQEQEHFIHCILGKNVPFVDGAKDIETLEIAHKILDQISKS